MGCCVARYIFVNKTALDVFDKIGAASRSFVHHLSVSEYDSESSFSKHHCSCLNLPTASNISDITNIGLVLYRFTISFPCHHKIKGAAKATVQTTTATVQTTTAPVQNYYGHIWTVAVVVWTVALAAS
uniref:AlNc14C136G7103 protein n=1 Tax=Albugo laibachii Nc14 TaxID=890382 RepID=F0WKR3_9STRA|nr:AlNc14C136G7103 [Albugo laibachii Nc14]|eukprot:CCA21870.1 AlNc14C136G7103 [Albugo laibachii Nc14]